MAGIQISIIAGKTMNTSHATASGHVQHIITDEERKTFNIKDDNLKDACGEYFGKRPNDVFLHSPSGFGDLYKRWNWDQTETVVTATSAEILDITSKPEILKTQEFVNDSSEAVTYTAGISDSVSHTATSTWSTGGTLTVGEKIKCDVSFLGTGGGTEDDISYSQSWGVGGSKSKTVTVGSNSGVQVTLKPGEKIITELTASRGVMNVRVRYTARLIGCTAVAYDHCFKGHFYWCFHINTVMNDNSICNSIETTEDIEIGYFSNGRITVKDGVTHEVKGSSKVSSGKGAGGTNPDDPVKKPDDPVKKPDDPDDPQSVEDFIDGLDI